MSPTAPTTAVASGVAVLLAASAAGTARRWLAADRTHRRLDLPVPAGRSVPPRLADALDSAGVPGSQHRTLVQTWVAAMAISVLSATTLPAGPVVVAVVVSGPPLTLLLASGRAARRRARDLPIALEAVVANLRAGHALPAAIAAVGETDGPVAVELAEVARRAAGGLPLAHAVDAWSRTHDDHGTRLAAAAMAVAAGVGGPGADAIEAAAASLRDRAAIDDEIDALSVQARASATLMSLTPVAFTALLASIDPSAARFLFGTRIGWACIVVGVGLDVLGAWWMQRLVRAAR